MVAFKTVFAVLAAATTMVVGAPLEERNLAKRYSGQATYFSEFAVKEHGGCCGISIRHAQVRASDHVILASAGLADRVPHNLCSLLPWTV